MLSDVLHERDL